MQFFGTTDPSTTHTPVIASGDAHGAEYNLYPDSDGFYVMEERSSEGAPRYWASTDLDELLEASGVGEDYETFSA